MAAIETADLTKRFDDLVAVDGLDLRVESGEAFGFLGPNGAGKSTTINVLLGFLDPTSGSATVLGHDVGTESLAVRDRLGVLPEGFEPYERLTAREHVEYAGGLKGCDPDVEALLDRVGLDPDAWDRGAGGYSRGMAQRLALATALVGDPDLLVLDEPSSGLDPEGMAEVRELICEEVEAGTTVFFSSHILSEVEAVCDRVGMLVDGQLETVGTLAELRSGTETRAPVTLTVDQVPEGVEADLSAMDGVASVTIDGGRIDVAVDDPARKIDVITAVGERAGVQDVVSETASLESMFRRYAARGRASGGGDGGAEQPASGTAGSPEVVE